MRFCQQTQVREPFSAGQQQPCPSLLNSMRCFRLYWQETLSQWKKRQTCSQDKRKTKPLTQLSSISSETIAASAGVAWAGVLFNLKLPEI